MSIWMSLILKLFASDVIFANHNSEEVQVHLGKRQWKLSRPQMRTSEVLLSALVEKM